MDINEYKKYVDTEVFRFLPQKMMPRFLRLWYLKKVNPSCCAVYYIRKMQFLAGRNTKLHRYLAKRYHMKLAKEFGMLISLDAKIGLGLKIPHPTSIVIGKCAVIGENFSIYQNCTIGGARIGDAKVGNQPTIGNNVTIFAGSMILGKVVVTDNVTVGANSVLLSNADEPGIYVGCPAKKH